jgi:hypothetical protein
VAFRKLAIRAFGSRKVAHRVRIFRYQKLHGARSCVPGPPREKRLAPLDAPRVRGTLTLQGRERRRGVGREAVCPETCHPLFPRDDCTCGTIGIRCERHRAIKEHVGDEFAFGKP